MKLSAEYEKHLEFTVCAVCNFLDRDPQYCGNRQTDISVYVPRQRLGTVSCKVCEMVHMRLTPQYCGNRQTEGNRKYKRGRDYLGSHVLADPSVVTRDHAPTPLCSQTGGYFPFPST